MDEGIVKIILAVIGLLGTIITVVLVPYIKSKTTANQRDNIFTLIAIAVSAAEQVLKIEDPTGEKRKRYVVEYLNTKGVKITNYDLDIFIEAAVKELNIVQDKALD